MLTQMAVSEYALDKNEQQQHMQQPLHPRVSKAQRRRALRIDNDRPLQVLEQCFADEAVVADALDVKQTSVGRKADLAQFGKVFDASADAKVTRIVVRNRPGVRRLILRSKIRLTWLGRPMSKFSRITSSKKTRPV